jgi:transcription antitermination factor NusG
MCFLFLTGKAVQFVRTFFEQGSLMHSKDRNCSWYALYVRSRFEKVVSRSLQGKGYEEYLPLFRMKRPWSDRTKEIELPLFPGYVFCKFNLPDRLPVLMIPGVYGIVSFGESAMAVDPGELDAVRSVLRSGSTFEPWPFLQVGPEVWVVSGPMTGTRGMVTRVRDGDRLVISVQALQRSVAVEISQDCLKVISHAKSPLMEG